MARYIVVQDQTKCIGCKACEIACLISKGLDPGVNLCLIVETGPKWEGNLPRNSFMYMGCFHCEDPWCLNACPKKAIQKRDDGIVFIEKDLCVGCKACITACPFGAVQWNEKEKKAAKCILCMKRLDKGMEPVCVTVCMTKCLSLEKVDEIAPHKREKLAKMLATSNF